MQQKFVSIRRYRIQKGVFERSVYAVRFLFKDLLVLLLVANHAYRTPLVKSFQVFNKNSCKRRPYRFQLPQARAICQLTGPMDTWHPHQAGYDGYRHAHA
jgi:hypothetical protein